MPWRGPEEPGEYPTGGFQVLDWIEERLLITDGAKLGRPFEFYDEQAQHILERYRIDPNATPEMGNDAFVYSGSQLVRGQKWGKDPVLAVLDIVHGFGPVNFDGWDADGEPVLRPHPSPWIFVAALNDKQADNTWLPLKAMVESSDLVDLPGVDVTQDQIRLPCGNPIERLTTTAYGRLGGRFTAGSLTENGLMTDTGEAGSGGQRSPLAFARTLLRSVTGMEGMWVGASNTWDPTAASHCQVIYEAKSKRVHMDARIARKKVDLADDDELAEELRWLYGDSLKEAGGHVSLKRLMEDCRDFKANGEAEVRRFFLSEILAGETPLCDKPRWDALAAIDVDGRQIDPLAASEAITLGFDGSRSRDATALTACRIRDGRIFHLKTWLPTCMCEEPDHRPEKCGDRRIDRRLVDQAIKDTFAAYDVAYLYADPYKWQEYLDLWAALWPKRVVEVPTNVETRMDRILERFTTAVREGEFSHSGDPTLTEHVQNAAIAKGGMKRAKSRVDDHGAVIRHYLKVVSKAPGVLKDAAISMLLALEARGQAVEDGALTRTPPPAPMPVGAAASTTATSSGDPDIGSMGF